MKKVYLSWEDVTELAERVAQKISHLGLGLNTPHYLYGIPRGGVYAALLVQRSFGGNNLQLTTQPENADIFIDDIVDSGRTKENWTREYNRPFFSLVIQDKNYPC